MLRTDESAIVGIREVGNRLLAGGDTIDVSPKPNGLNVVFDATGVGFSPNAGVADERGLNAKPPLDTGGAAVAECNGDPNDNEAVGLNALNAEDVGAVFAILSAG